MLCTAMEATKSKPYKLLWTGAAQLPGTSTPSGVYTDKKENQIFLKYKEIRNGAVAKSYMRKSFLIYDEMRNEEAVNHILLCNCSILNFLIQGADDKLGQTLL